MPMFAFIRGSFAYSAYMKSRSASVTISRVSSSWLRRKMPHCADDGMSGVESRISEMGNRDSRRTAMKMRGISGKWNAMWHSSPPTSGSPKYSTTSSGHWLASASRTQPGYSSSMMARHFFRNACVSGRFSQLVPSRSKRYGTASSRKPSMPRSDQNRRTSIIASCTAGLS